MTTKTTLAITLAILLICVPIGSAQVLDQVERYLATNTIDENAYITTYDNHYVCGEFSYDLATDLQDAGFIAGVVLVYLPNLTADHIVVYVDIGSDTIIIEPQSDQMWIAEDYPLGTNDTLTYHDLEWGGNIRDEMHRRAGI